MLSLRFLATALLHLALFFLPAASLGAQTALVQDPTQPRAYRVVGGDGVAAATFQLPTLAGAAPTVSITSHPDDWVLVRADWQLAGVTQQDHVAASFSLALTPDFQWIPHLAPESGDVVAQHVFRAPAIIVAEGARHLAIVPDLEFCAIRNEAPWYLDYDAPAGTAEVGIGLTLQRAHVIYRKAPGMLLRPGLLRLGFFVKVWDDLGQPKNPFAEPSKFLWNTYGSVFFNGGHPHRVPMAEYVDRTYSWAFDRWKDVVWRESVDREIGGTQLLVDVSQSPTGNTSPLNGRATEIWNQAWYCALRSAGGMQRIGAALGDADLLRRATQSKELALAAPRAPNGDIFPSVAVIKRTVRGGRFHRGDLRWTNSDRSPRMLGISRAWYHVLDASNTALWMLRWYSELERDPRLLDYVVTYAEWLLETQTRDGFFPAWLHPRTLAPAPLLTDSPETARSAGMLFELGELTGDPRYVASALRAVRAVVRGPAAEGRWEDFESYWSDNTFGNVGNFGRRFARNAIFKQNTLSMFWTAEALLAAWRATRQPIWLNWGVRTLDELSMSQSVWQPPFMYVPVVGGFGVMNADGEWNDARQSLFAELFMDYYRETGDPNHFERGAAALKAGFAMMYSPLNPPTRRQWEAAHPGLDAIVDEGFSMENYGHNGFTHPLGGGMGFFTIFDWGCGSASEAFARVTDHYGQVYIDRARGRGFGIDTIEVTAPAAAGGLWTLTDRTGAPRDLRVRFDDGSERRVRINGTATVR